MYTASRLCPDFGALPEVVCGTILVMPPSKMPVLADRPLKRSVPSAGLKRSAMGASVSTLSPQSNLQQAHTYCKPTSLFRLDKLPVEQANGAAAQMASIRMHQGRQGQPAGRSHLRRASCRSTAQDTASLGSANATMKTPSRSYRDNPTRPFLQEASRAATAKHSNGPEYVNQAVDLLSAARVVFYWRKLQLQQGTATLLVQLQQAVRRAFQKVKHPTWHS